MASITFAIDEDIQGRIKEFSWVNWSEIAREELLQKYKMQNLLKQLESKGEQELTRWSVELGHKSKAGRLKKLKSKGLI